MEEIQQWYAANSDKSLSGRHIHLKHIQPVIESLSDSFEITEEGLSVLDQPVYSIKIGSGTKKVLMWSQMHGNESTTTKAVFDLLKFLESDLPVTRNIINNCTLLIIPILNPDGAKAYTRINANEVDLNRDAQHRSQPESIILRTVFERFKPDYCFNLHDQRTIFSAGKTSNPATVSFLSPAEDENRTITTTRKKSMEIIAEMNKVLQTIIPDCVGRYDDGFNLNCVGDTFQALHVPTVLFESGHYPGDYAREKTREFIFYAMVTALNYISGQEIVGDGFQPYFDIPENDKLFYDIIIRNYKNNEKEEDIAVQFVETLKDEELLLVPEIVKTGGLSDFFGHLEIDGKKPFTKTFEIKGFRTIDITETLIK